MVDPERLFITTLREQQIAGKAIRISIMATFDNIRKTSFSDSLDIRLKLAFFLLTAFMVSFSCNAIKDR